MYIYIYKSKLNLFFSLSQRKQAVVVLCFLANKVSQIVITLVLVDVVKNLKKIYFSSIT